MKFLFTLAVLAAIALIACSDADVENTTDVVQDTADAADTVTNDTVDVSSDAEIDAPDARD